jgi:excisionase family DNA binding protein
MSIAGFSEFADAFAEHVAELVAQRVAGDVASAAPAGESEFMRVADAAKFLGWTVPAVRMAVKRGGVPFHKIGSRVVFDRAELREWVKGSS